MFAHCQWWRVSISSPGLSFDCESQAAKREREGKASPLLLRLQSVREALGKQLQPEGVEPAFNSICIVTVGTALRSRLLSHLVRRAVRVALVEAIRQFEHSLRRNPVIFDCAAGCVAEHDQQQL